MPVPVPVNVLEERERLANQASCHLAPNPDLGFKPST